MRKSRMKAGGVTMLLLGMLSMGGMVGCQQTSSGTSANAVMVDDLMIENESLREELSERNMALQQANDELRDRSQELAQTRRQLDDAERQTPVVMGQPNVQPASYGATGFEGISDVQASVGAGEITATIGSDILFQPGKAVLRTEAKRSLDQIARVLNDEHVGHGVRVTGHTDADPIRKSGHKSNHHLGFERAFAVRDYLISKGVDTSRVYCASYGPDRPLSSKSDSRRVDIVVLLN